jgi:uncharacterized membrane protein
MLLFLIGIIAFIIGFFVAKATVSNWKFGGFFYTGIIIMSIGLSMAIFTSMFTFFNVIDIERQHTENYNDYVALCELKEAAEECENKYIIVDCNNRLTEWNMEYNNYIKSHNNL